MKRTWTNALLVLIAVTAVCLSGTSVMAQRGGGGRPGGGGGFPGFGGGGGGIIELALRDEVQKELELLPGQVDDLTKLGEADRAGQRERFQGLFGGLDRNASEADRTAARERIGAEMRKIAAETQSKVDEILLPHQSKRLSQLAMQRRLRGGIGGALDNEEIVSQLAIGQRDIDALKAKAEKAEEAFRDQVAALRREMQADLLKALSPAQQAKYQDLVGDPFEFAADERTNFGQGGQPGGGRQGGGRPGGGTRGQRPTQ